VSSEQAKQAAFFAKLGSTQLRSGASQKASDYFDKALALDPRNVDAVVGKGEVFLARGSTSQAIKTLSKAVRMRKSAHVYTLLGDAYLRADKPEKSADNYKRALRLDPDSKRARDGYNAAAKLIPPPEEDEDDEDEDVPDDEGL
jgi:Tfp pilus assembly protein PilF